MSFSLPVDPYVTDTLSRSVVLQACPSCRGEHMLDVTGSCPRCRGEWVSGAHIEALAQGRLAFLKRFAARGPPTEKDCPWDRTALKAFDVPGFQYEGDLFWGKEQARAAGTCIAEGCSACGSAWIEADQLSRGGGRKAVLDGLARLAESLQ